MVDLIKVETAIAVVKQAIEENADYRRRLTMIPAVRVNDIRSIKQGRWIYRKADGGFHTDVVCSICKSKFAIGWNYCPNCGAEMGAK